MKPYLKTSIKFILFIMVTFIVFSLFLATIMSFIPITNFIYHLIINIIALLIMIIWGFILVKTIKSHVLIHGLWCSLIFILIAIVLNLKDINILNIVSRPLVLLITILILSNYQKRIN